MNQIAMRKKVRRATHQDEHQAVTQLLHANPLSIKARDTILQDARHLVTNCRADKNSSGTLDAFLLEFGLSNAEGVALMCLAEALLRVPDTLTADRLIAEKIQAGNWSLHRGQSESLFVNASTWGLMLTGQLVSLDREITQDTDHWVKRLTATMGEPVIRAAVMQAMKIMGGQYVLGRTITEGLKRGTKHNDPQTRFSFDMLGEGARTEADAAQYLKAYGDAIDEIGKTSNRETNVYSANGISVKLSAIHPRYYFSQHQAVMSELLPRIKQLCLQAKKYNIGLSIDAEEAYRLDISLDIFEALAKDSELGDWQGLGFVLQAYQKRAPDTAKWLIGLAKETDRRIMVRLVKGAYWDAEIKHAQELGLASYPVFTRKANTDLCYQHCAGILLDAEENIYPQFATHNAYTATMILKLAGEREFEFQRLHGMGHILYAQLKTQIKMTAMPIPLAVRVYAPIGNHKDLLPYLVRRLLENGANSSFVNRFLDHQTPVEELLKDTRDQVTSSFPYQHKMIAIPDEMFTVGGEERKNAVGIDLDSPLETEALLSTIKQTAELLSHPIIDGRDIQCELQPAYNPANQKQLIGHYSKADEISILTALESSHAAQPTWNTLGHQIRADILGRVADLMERDCAELMGVVALEAGRTLGDGISEVREAVDFCRYYALQARSLAAQGLQGQGVFLCISPWNFPLAIFVGQIAAALAAGNTVIAKPAAQTPAIAACAIRLFHKAGVPGPALQLLLGSGAQIGKLLVGDSRIAGIAFTGSTGTAQSINQQLAARPGGPINFIAETGGQNCMVVDSTALPEQVVDDVISSAFQSAGQRCSALRVLFIQSDIADNTLKMLAGAMASMKAGDPRLLSSDLGPVIDGAAQAELQTHIDRMNAEATFIAKVELEEQCVNGSYIAPHVFEINSLDQLNEEVFGPILHVIRYSSEQLGSVIQQINDTGYGLTLGIHSRIEAFAETVFRNTIAGNTYINRNMVGAVVGVNPFGGRGLSGTGPKAGGPNYLMRFSRETTQVDNERSFPIDLEDTKIVNSNSVVKAVKAMPNWQARSIDGRLAILQAAITRKSTAEFLPILKTIARGKLANPIQLLGPTGEDNRLSLHGRGVMVLVVLESDLIAEAEKQIASALLCGCPVIVTVDRTHINQLEAIRTGYQRAGLAKQLLQIEVLGTLTGLIQNNSIEGIMANCKNADSTPLRQAAAKRTGSIIPLIEWPRDNEGYNYHWLLWFLSERTRTENLVARGGNTQLFNLTE
ncbi:MAG: bifunctional proline dehydrogenase/L-glutamate gamma-semialdehyde dehydrogenase PutA [Porticoccaceae bacterium]|nr:bifunctional proline dehydrogenase/L-glutamate gamma-semialdehyde dehydrogenase PutA [Porticoccaceae bacterium]